MQNGPDGGAYALRWLGRDEPHLDAPAVARAGPAVLGCYGGNTRAGASKNEDGALVWCAADGGWEFATIVDAHYSAESAALILAAVAAQAEPIAATLAGPPERFAAGLHSLLLDTFAAPTFRARCRQVEGEASCLICARRDRYLWWLAVGDCVLYLFHPELARLGQFALNQRSFFEWIGQRNTFDLAVPCYAAGTRELPPGPSRILLTTDGLLECGRRPFADPAELYRLFAPGAEADAGRAAHAALERVHRERGRDSATLIAWGADARYVPR
jgi:hypothetical protein